MKITITESNPDSGNTHVLHNLTDILVSLFCCFLCSRNILVRVDEMPPIMTSVARLQLELAERDVYHGMCCRAERFVLGPQVLITMHGSEDYEFVTVEELGWSNPYNPNTHGGDHQTIVFVSAAPTQTSVGSMTSAASPHHTHTCTHIHAHTHTQAM